MMKGHNGRTKKRSEIMNIGKRNMSLLVFSPFKYFFTRCIYTFSSFFNESLYYNFETKYCCNRSSLKGEIFNCRPCESPSKSFEISERINRSKGDNFDV